MLEADSNTDPLKDMPFGQNQRGGGNSGCRGVIFATTLAGGITKFAE